MWDVIGIGAMMIVSNALTWALARHRANCASHLCDRLRSKKCSDGCCRHCCRLSCGCETKPEVIADDVIERAIARMKTQEKAGQ